jgi:RNA polymerase sigma-70 factor (ECF subfamily)
MCTALLTVMTNLEDDPARIAHGLRQRDPQILEALVDRYQHRLFRYLMHLTGRKALAEDLFQGTWLRVLERGRHYDGRSPFVPWLLSVARHLTVDHLRRRDPLSLESLGEEPIGGLPLAVKQPSPFDEVAAGEEETRLTLLAARLPAIHREVLSLRFQEELTLDEIARVTGVPLPTVKSRLYRALESVRRLWGVRP